MRDTARAERLLSLLTSRDCAAAIAGDLTEDRHHRGSLWFWLQVLRTMTALWRRALTDAPLGVLSLAVAGFALFAAPAFGGVAAVGVFPQSIGSPASWFALSFFWWGGALWTGASLVGLAPRRGMAACVTLAVTGEALLLAFGAMTPRSDLLAPEFLLFYVTGLVVAAPLLAGGALGHRRMIAVITTLERHR